MKTACFLILTGVALAFLGLVAPAGGGVARATGTPCADLDNDGDVDTNDISIVTTYLGQSVPPAPPEVDLIKDGFIAVSDISAAVAAGGGPGFCLPPTVSIPRKGCPAADVNKDGIVSVSDIGEVVTDFGAAPPAAPVSNPNTDISGDGFVSVGDIGMAVVMFGTTC
ncbi:MAG: hypothetical protein WEE64_12755 [Dehalococcoidia bacterium]